jgi:hypothetical protein
MGRYLAPNLPETHKKKQRKKKKCMSNPCHPSPSKSGLTEGGTHLAEHDDLLLQQKVDRVQVHHHGVVGVSDVGAHVAPVRRHLKQAWGVSSSDGEGEER